MTHVSLLFVCCHFLTTSLAIYTPKPKGTDALNSSLPPRCHVFLSYITGFEHESNPFKPWAHTHRSVIIVNIATLTLCQPVMSRATLDALLSCTHVNTAYLLNITCTLVVVKSVVLGRFECTQHHSS